MTLVLNGTTGVSSVDGSASTPAIQGTDSNTGVFFPAADTIAWTTGGTERMRVDSSGNVGIGTSSPSTLLDVAAVAPVLSVRSTSTSDASRQATLRLNVPSTGGDDPSGKISFTYGSGYTQTAAIDSVLTSGGAAGILRFFTSTTERARIDNNGNLLVGTTSPASNVGGFQVSYNPGSGKFAGAVVNTKTDNSTVTQGFLVKYTGVSPSDGNYIFLCQDSGNTNRFFVTNAGGTGGTSDAALKKNIETTRDGYVNDLCKIRIVKYNWKTQDDNAPKYLGWIAQEVEEVFPRMVETDPETGFKSVTYSPFVPMLIKAVQEQQALIESLTARIAALEGAQA